MKKLLLLTTLFTLYTHHSNTQWVQQTVPVSKPITGIKFINANTGWACTSWGTGMDTSYILYTSNGGINWLVQHAALNARYNALSVIDANNIYAGGDSSARAKFSKTINGGLNWVDIQTPVNMSIEDMVFQNKDSGWSCSGVVGPDVRTTTNGGLNWIVRTSGMAQQTHRLFFLNYNTGFCGANSFLYKTTNAGLNWILNSNFSESVASIFFMNQATGWLGLSGGKVALTSNGGANWFIQQPFPLNGNTTTDIYFINSNTGFAGTGWFQKILKTTNGGINWGYQIVPTGSVRISIVDSLNCWAADLGISHTTNGGGMITYVGINNISTEIPGSFKLHQNYPNPFNPVTNFKFEIPEYSFVNVTIYDILGRKVKTEVENYLRPGTYRINFYAANLPSGTYFYRLTTNNYTETKKMILIK
ncbi:MAG: T9SS type A sorting domain-containing protein [Ignavibacteria bacterium]